MPGLHTIGEVDVVRVHGDGSEHQNHHQGQHVDEAEQRLQRRIFSSAASLGRWHCDLPMACGRVQRGVFTFQAILAERRRSEFAITLTDDRAMAAAAMAGDKVNPKKG